ncbi:unnamed protein product [uncultured bacterium]|nr:unnamed protein product [uncultured bacterium]
MKVRMLTIMSGPDVYHDVGEVIDVPDAMAKAMVEGRHAEYVDEPKASHAPHAAPRSTDAPHKGETAEHGAHRPGPK